MSSFWKEVWVAVHTMSFCSSWAPASTNFFTTSRCPSEHALCSAVRLYWQLKQCKVTYCIWHKEGFKSYPFETWNLLNFNSSPRAESCLPSVLKDGRSIWSVASRFAMTPVELPVQLATLCFESAAYALWSMRAATYFCCSAEKILIFFHSIGRSPFMKNQVLLGTNSLLLNIKTLLR